MVDIKKDLKKYGISVDDALESMTANSLLLFDAIILLKRVGILEEFRDIVLEKYGEIARQLVDRYIKTLREEGCI